VFMTQMHSRRGRQCEQSICQGFGKQIQTSAWKKMLFVFESQDGDHIRSAQRGIKSGEHADEG